MTTKTTKPGKTSLAPAKSATKTPAKAAATTARTPATRVATRAATQASTPAANPAARKPARPRAEPAAAAAQAAQTIKPAPVPTPPPSSTVAEAANSKQGKKLPKPRPVLVRDSFTMPEDDFALIAQLKTTALGASRAAKKSELLRAGLRLLVGMDAESLVVALNRLATVKTGRPKKGH